MSAERQRCPWCGDDPLYVAYHDREWGVPIHDERIHFEFLTLEGAQAGLSWATILKRRDGYRSAFAGFDPHIVARMDDSDVNRLLTDKRIIRNRAKIRSAISNAQAFLQVTREFGTFDAYIWRFVGGRPVQNNWTSLDQVPVTTPVAEQLSKDLKSRGFSFVGPTIIYAHMQAIGLVNDHLVSCFRHGELGGRS